MANTRTYSPDSPVYFPSLGEWAKPGDTVTVTGDGVVTGLKVKGAPYDPEADPTPPVPPADPQES